jgi:hypothetical protein
MIVISSAGLLESLPGPVITTTSLSRLCAAAKRRDNSGWPDIEPLRKALQGIDANTRVLRRTALYRQLTILLLNPTLY